MPDDNERRSDTILASPPTVERSPGRADAFQNSHGAIVIAATLVIDPPVRAVMRRTVGFRPRQRTRRVACFPEG